MNERRQPMLLTELFRRGVVVPLDDDAERELSQMYATESTRVRYLPIEGDAYFSTIFRAGFFDEINRTCGTNIDDYEEEYLEPELISKASRALSQRFVNLQDRGLCEFRDDLLDLLSEAQAAGKPVFFIL